MLGRSIKKFMERYEFYILQMEVIGMREAGVVYWFTGLSGAGKTTIGKFFYDYLRNQKDNVVFLDNDELKDVLWTEDIGYSREQRKKRSFVGGRLAKLLSEQGMDVICCAISMFDDVRKWNRDNIYNYKEIYLDVPMEILVSRNSKGLYNKLKKDIVGLDIIAEFPKTPDIVIYNDGSDTIENIVRKIINEFHIG